MTKHGVLILNRVCVRVHVHYHFTFMFIFMFNSLFWFIFFFQKFMQHIKAAWTWTCSRGMGIFSAFLANPQKQEWKLKQSKKERRIEYE